MIHARKDYQKRIIDLLPEQQGGIPADEPVFLLRGKDKAAAHAVRCWATIADAMGADPRMVEAAHAQADLMETWPDKQVPDRPEDTYEQG